MNRLSDTGQSHQPNELNQRNSCHGATINFFNNCKRLQRVTLVSHVRCICSQGRGTEGTNADEWSSLWRTQGRQQWTCLSKPVEQKKRKGGRAFAQLNARMDAGGDDKDEREDMCEQCFPGSDHQIETAL